MVGTHFFSLTLDLSINREIKLFSIQLIAHILQSGHLDAILLRGVVYPSVKTQFFNLYTHTYSATGAIIKYHHIIEKKNKFDSVKTTTYIAWACVCFLLIKIYLWFLLPDSNASMFYAP